LASTTSAPKNPWLARLCGFLPCQPGWFELDFFEKSSKKLKKGVDNWDCGWYYSKALEGSGPEAGRNQERMYLVN
jgi:hypothetical protein